MTAVAVLEPTVDGGAQPPTDVPETAFGGDEESPLVRLSEELVQVAAVAVAALEDLGWDGGTNLLKTDTVLHQVFLERCAQEDKWGSQRHDPFTWMQILMEEVGEAAEEARKLQYGDQFPFLLQGIVRAGMLARRWLRENFEGQS